MNTATKLLNHIGGTAAAMLRRKEEAKEIAAFLRQDRIDNPPTPRAPKLFRQYNKRYS